MIVSIDGVKNIIVLRTYLVAELVEVAEDADDLAV